MNQKKYMIIIKDEIQTRKVRSYKYNEHALLEEILSDDKFACLDVVCHFSMNMLIKNLDLLNERECEYAMIPNTHIDLLLYNRISKKPVLAIEVDGWDYHKEGTVQASRDLIKDHILEVYGIPLLRFKTNGSGGEGNIVGKIGEDYGIGIRTELFATRDSANKTVYY